MKKLIIPSIIIVVLGVFITVTYFLFFKTDKITCSSNTNDDFRTTKEIIEVYYKKNSVKKIIQETNHNFVDAESKNTFKSFLDDAYDNISNMKYTDTSKKDEGLLYETKVKINVDKLNDTELNSLSISSDLKELQDILGSNGFECKMK